MHKPQLKYNQLQTTTSHTTNLGRSSVLRHTKPTNAQNASQILFQNESGRNPMVNSFKIKGPEQNKSCYQVPNPRSNVYADSKVDCRINDELQNSRVGVNRVRNAGERLGSKAEDHRVSQYGGKGISGSVAADLDFSLQSSQRSGILSDKLMSSQQWLSTADVSAGLTEQMSVDQGLSCDHLHFTSGSRNSPSNSGPNYKLGLDRIAVASSLRIPKLVQEVYRQELRSLERENTPRIHLREGFLKQSNIMYFIIMNKLLVFDMEFVKGHSPQTQIYYDFDPIALKEICFGIYEIPLRHVGSSLLCFGRNQAAQGELLSGKKNAATKSDCGITMIEDHKNELLALAYPYSIEICAYIRKDKFGDSFRKPASQPFEKIQHITVSECPLQMINLHLSLRIDSEKAEFIQIVSAPKKSAQAQNPFSTNEELSLSLVYLDERNKVNLYELKEVRQKGYRMHARNLRENFLRKKRFIARNPSLIESAFHRVKNFVTETKSFFDVFGWSNSSRNLDLIFDQKSNRVYTLTVSSAAQFDEGVSSLGKSGFKEEGQRLGVEEKELKEKSGHGAFSLLHSEEQQKEITVYDLNPVTKQIDCRWVIPEGELIKEIRELGTEMESRHSHQFNSRQKFANPFSGNSNVGRKSKRSKLEKILCIKKVDRSFNSEVDLWVYLENGTRYSLQIEESKVKVFNCHKTISLSELSRTTTEYSEDLQKIRAEQHLMAFLDREYHISTEQRFGVRYPYGEDQSLGVSRKEKIQLKEVHCEEFGQLQIATSKFDSQLYINYFDRETQYPFQCCVSKIMPSWPSLSYKLESEPSKAWEAQSSMVDPGFCINAVPIVNKVCRVADEIGLTSEQRIYLECFEKGSQQYLEPQKGTTRGFMTHRQTERRMPLQSCHELLRQVHYPCKKFSYRTDQHLMEFNVLRYVDIAFMLLYHFDQMDCVKYLQSSLKMQKQDICCCLLQIYCDPQGQYTVCSKILNSFTHLLVHSTSKRINREQPFFQRFQMHYDHSQSKDKLNSKKDIQSFRQFTADSTVTHSYKDFQAEISPKILKLLEHLCDSETQSFNSPMHDHARKNSNFTHSLNQQQQHSEQSLRSINKFKNLMSSLHCFVSRVLHPIWNVHIQGREFLVSVRSIIKRVDALQTAVKDLLHKFSNDLGDITFYGVQIFSNDSVSAEKKNLDPDSCESEYQKLLSFFIKLEQLCEMVSVLPGLLSDYTICELIEQSPEFFQRHLFTAIRKEYNDRIFGQVFERKFPMFLTPQLKNIYRLYLKVSNISDPAQVLKALEGDLYPDYFIVDYLVNHRGISSAVMFSSKAGGGSIYDPIKIRIPPQHCSSPESQAIYLLQEVKNTSISLPEKLTYLDAAKTLLSIGSPEPQFQNQSKIESISGQSSVQKEGLLGDIHYYRKCLKLQNEIKNEFLRSFVEDEQRLNTQQQKSWAQMIKASWNWLLSPNRCSESHHRLTEFADSPLLAGSLHRPESLLCGNSLQNSGSSSSLYNEMKVSILHSLNQKCLTKQQLQQILFGDENESMKNDLGVKNWSYLRLLHFSIFEADCKGENSRSVMAVEFENRQLRLTNLWKQVLEDIKAKHLKVHGFADGNLEFPPSSWGEAQKRKAWDSMTHQVKSIVQKVVSFLSLLGVKVSLHEYLKAFEEWLVTECCYVRESFASGKGLIKFHPNNSSMLNSLKSSHFSSSDKQSNLLVFESNLLCSFGYDSDPIYQIYFADLNGGLMALKAKYQKSEGGAQISVDFWLYEWYSCVELCIKHRQRMLAPLIKLSQDMLNFSQQFLNNRKFKIEKKESENIKKKMEVLKQALKETKHLNDKR